MQQRFASIVTTLTLALALVASLAVAQPYPAKTLKIIVPYPPGGTSDILARSVSEKLAAAPSTTVIVDEFGAFIRGEKARWAKVVNEANVKIE